MGEAVLIVLGGRPGVGKTTLARALAREHAAALLRVDVIEQALRGPEAMAGAVGAAGYLVGYALATSNLLAGRAVVADCANPLTQTREAWRRAGALADARVVEVEVVCSDADEHRRRVEERVADIPGHVLPGWADVRSMRYEPWSGPVLRVDTAGGVAAGLAAIRAAVGPSGTRSAP